jgi:aspartate kinase
LNAQAVEFAKRKGIVILAKSTFAEGGGTAVRDLPVAASGRVKGVAADSDLAVITSSPDVRLAELLEFLEVRGVRGRLLAMDSLGDRGTFLTAPLADVHGVAQLEADLSARFAGRAGLHQGLGTVTCVGAGIGADLALVRRSLSAADECRAKVMGVHASPLQITLLVDRESLPALTRRLHDTLVAA